MADATDDKKVPAQAVATREGQPAPTPTEVDDEQLAAVVGGVLRRGGDDDLDDLEVER